MAALKELSSIVLRSIALDDLIVDIDLLFIRSNKENHITGKMMIGS